MNQYEILHKKYRRAELGIDGNCGFALLGPNIQEGEAEFVEVTNAKDTGVSFVIPTGKHAAELIAAKLAFVKLKERLGLPLLSYWFGPSHPYGN